MPVLLILIIVGILVGAWFLLRSPPPPAAAEAAHDQGHVDALREAVLAKLRDRLVGWRLETDEAQPLHVGAFEVGTERRVLLDLGLLAKRWIPLHAAGKAEESDAEVEAFIEAATGASESGEAAVERSWAREALSLQLAREVKAGLLARPVGEGLHGILVLRGPEGADQLDAEALAELGFEADEAFAAARENLAHDVADGLDLEPFDPSHPHDAVRVAPGDPVAASYALVGALGGKLQKALGDRAARLVLARPDLLVAYAEGSAAPELERVLVSRDLAPGDLAGEG